MTSKSNSGPRDQKAFRDSVRDYYDSFSPEHTLASRLTFYSELKKEFPGLKIPDSTAKLTFGCANPVSKLIDDFKSKKRAFAEPVKILDAGGGAGFDSFLLRQIFTGATVCNVDLSQNLLELGRNEFKKHLGVRVNETGGVFFVRASLDEPAVFKNIKFDYILSNAALNLVADKRKFFSAAAELLSEDGSFFLADIAYSGSSSAPRDFAGRPLADGVYYAPTIISENDYARMIFEHFGYGALVERNQMKPEKVEGGQLELAVFCRHIKKRPPAERETIPCPCGNRIELEVFLSANAESSPLFVQMIIDRRLNSAFCVKCRRAFYDFIPFHFEWPEKKIEAHIFPASLKAESATVMARLGIFGEPPENFVFFGYEDFRKYLIQKTAE